MPRRERLHLLLAAGLSLGVHAAGALVVNYPARPLESEQDAPARVMQISLSAPQPVPPPEAVPVPRIEPTPAPPARSAPPRTEPAREPASRPQQSRQARQPLARPATLPAPEPPPRVAEVESQPEPAPPAPAVAAAQGGERESYLARLLAHIDSHKFYPRSARQRGQEGEVHVAFQLLQDGGICALKISGGSRALRAAAERAVQGALPLPRPPASLDLQQVISFSMQYRLKG